MAVQTATNPDTGKQVALVDGEWQPVVKTATNPDTGAKAFLVGNQWLVNEATSKPAPKLTPKEEPVVPRETVAEERPDLGSPMGESFISEVASSGAPKRQSVLQGKQLPTPTAPTVDKYVLDPKFVTGLEGQLNALPEEERQAKLDKLATRPDVYGRAAKLIQQRYANYNAITQPTVSKAFDPRLEAQTERFMEQGAGAETAQAEAERQARRGQIGRNLAQITETPEAVQEGMEYKLPANATPFEQTLNTVQRGVKLGALGTETAIRGTHRFIGDMLGMDLPGFDTKKNLDKINEFTQGMGENASKPLQIVEGAISSIAQQLPYMLAGAVTGSEAAVLVPMFTNSFGQNYDEARRAGLDPETSTVRSTVNSFFEVLGEKAGLGAQMKALKASTKGIPTSELVAHYTKALSRDVPGELLTYGGEYPVDAVLGLNPNAGWKDFLKGAVETMLSTVVQGGMMMAGGAGVNKVVRTLAGPQQKQIQQEQQQEVPPPPPPPANKTVPIAPGITTPGEQEPAATKVPTVDKEAKIKKLAEDYMNSGYQEEDALAQAKDEVYAGLGITPEAAGPIESNKLKAWSQPMLEGTLDLQLKKPADKRDKGLMAQLEAELIRRQGEQNVTRPVTTPARVSTGAPSQPVTNVPTGGVGGTQPNGVVPTPENVRLPVGGEATQPAPVAPAPTDIAAIVEPTLDQDIATQKKLLGALDEARKKLLKDENLASGDPRIDAAKNAVEKAQNEYDAYVTESEPRRTKRIEELTKVKETPTLEEQIKEEDERNAALEAKKAKVESIARINASTAFDQVGAYPSLQEAIDSHETNVMDTLHEEGFTNDPDYDYLFRAASSAFDAEVNRLKGEQVGTETPETKQATQEGQAQPTPTKRGPKGARLTPEEKEAKAAANKPKVADNTAADRANKKYGAQLEEAAKPIDPDTETDKVEAAEQEKKDLRRTALEELIKAQAKVGSSPAGKRIKALLAKHATPQQIEDIKKGMAEREKRLASYTKENVLTGNLETRGYNASATVGRRHNTSPVNRGFNKVTNAAQAIQQIRKTGNFFQKLLAGKLSGFVNGVSFHVIEKGQPLPEVLQRNMDTWGRASAIYIRDEATGKRSIYVRGESFGQYHGVNNVDVLHELLHAATNQKIYLGIYSSAKGLEPNAALTKFAKELTNIMVRAERHYNKLKEQGALPQEVIDRVESTRDENGDLAIFEQPEEFLAYGMSDENIQDFLMGMEGKQKDETAFSSFVRAIMKLFGIGDGYYNGFSDLVNVTSNILDSAKTPQMRTIERGEMKAAQMAKGQTEKVSATTTKQDLDKIAEDNALVKKNLEALAVSTDPEVVGKATSALQVLRNPSKLLGATARAINGLGYGAKSFLLNIPTTDAVSALSGIDSLKRANIELERMTGMGRQMLDSAGKIIDSIEKRFEESNDPTLHKKVNLFTYATQGINPVTNKNVPQINAMWNSLGPAGQTIFKDIVKYYDHMYKYTGTLLKQIVAEASQGTSQGPVILKQLNDLLAADNKIESYVPLLRDQGGKFFIRVKDSGAFFIRDSLAKREALVANISKKTGKTRKQLIADGDITLGNNVADLRKTALSSSTLLKEIVTLVETSPTSPQMGIDDISRQDVTDSIIQLWLQLQPEQSMRKGFIHRKTTPGYDVDVVQGLVRSAIKFSIQIPKLKYGRMIRNSISSAKSFIAETPEMTPYVLEMERRANSVLNPPPPSDNPIQQKVVATLRFANSMAYTYYLSQATALANTISAYELGVPQLLKKHSVAEVTTEMGKLMAVWSSLSKKDANGNLVMPTIAGSSTVTDNSSDNAEQKQRKSEDRRAISAMKALNVSESTAARAMYGKIEIPSEHYGSKVEKAKYIAKQVATLGVSEIIHATERISREIIYLASFRLNRNKALAKFRKTLAYQTATDKIAAEAKYIDDNFEALTLAAKKDVDQSLFNYSTANRPAWLKSDVGQFLFQFMMWRLSAAQFIARNFIGMVKPMDGDTRAECMRAFFAVLGTSWSVAGTVGMPLLGTVFAFMSALYDRERDKLPADMRQLDPKTWYKTTWLKEQLGDITIGGKSLDTIIRQGPINAFTGVDVGSHVSMSDLFFNTEFKEGSNKGIRAEIANYVMSLAPPAITMSVNIIDGLSMMSHGDTKKGFEKVVPSAAWRNLLTTQRYATEGETGKNNEKILNAQAMRISELVGQAVGLRPVIIKDIKDATQAEFKLRQKVEGKQNELLADMFKAYSKQDAPEYKRLYQETYEFNKKYAETYPEYEIDEDLINNSFDAKEQALSESWRGARVTEKNLVPAYRLLSPSRKAAAEREAQAQ